MLNVLVVMLLAPSHSMPEASIKIRERVSDPTPVTDKDLRPMKAPDCRNELEIQKALEQLDRGEPGDCFIRDMKRITQR